MKASLWSLLVDGGQDLCLSPMLPVRKSKDTKPETVKADRVFLYVYRCSENQLSVSHVSVSAGQSKHKCTSGQEIFSHVGHLEKWRRKQAPTAPSYPVPLWFTLLGRSSICPQHKPSAWLLADVGWVGGKRQHAEESGIFFQLSFYPIHRTLKDLFDTVFVVVQLKRIIVCVWRGSQRQQSCLSAVQGFCFGFCDPPSWTRVSWACGCTVNRCGWLPKCITRR